MVNGFPKDTVLNPLVFSKTLTKQTKLDQLKVCGQGMTMQVNLCVKKTFLSDCVSKERRRLEQMEVPIKDRVA